METRAAYAVPAEEIRCMMTVSNSRFIASLAPVFTIDDAKVFIVRIRAEFPDATHNVPAYLIGGGESVVAHCNDDGEPSGTAGRPALAVLKGSGLGDVAVVITRYFGGTKLGTGGLVRAYQDATRLVVTEVPRAEKRRVHLLLLETPYPFLERLRRFVPSEQGLILEETFGAQVTMTIQLPVEGLESFQTALGELSNGKLHAEVMETRQVLFKLQI
jgi:uncharacterized YigZ family protein